MTPEELESMLEGRNLMATLDIKTLVLDMVRHMSEEELLEIFWKKLDMLNTDEVRGYFYMRRS
jgi:hypothetical protein